MTPALILARDRLTMARRMATELEARGLEVILLDCNSAYPPMLEWLAACPYRVIRSGADAGWDAPWTPDRSGLTPVERVMGEPGRGCRYVVTDHDLDIAAVPPDMVARLASGLDSHPDAVKAGLSLRLDDLPAALPWDGLLPQEEQYWRHPAGDGWYRCALDTTLALYDTRRPMAPRVVGPALRSAPPYAARHLPWYQVTVGDLAEEDIFYYKRHAMPGHWSRAAYLGG